MASTEPMAVTGVTAQVEGDLIALIKDLREGEGAADPMTAKFIESITGRAVLKGSGLTMNIMMRLPILVHGAESGELAPAKLASIIHILWWTAARFLDDLIDSEDNSLAGSTDCNKGILASMAAGILIPMRLVSAADVPAVTRTRLCAELSRGWMDAISGQLLDLDAGPGSATPDSVLQSYRGKTGAPYAMACAMAATLAGADPRRTDRWHDFGVSFGVLRQLINDQLDLSSGRDEDLINGTATYLLAHLMRSADATKKEKVLDLYSAAAKSVDARNSLRELLLDPAVFDDYIQSIRAMVYDVHGILDEIGGEQEYLDGLHSLIDEAMSQSPRGFVIDAGPQRSAR